MYNIRNTTLQRATKYYDVLRNTTTYYVILRSKYYKILCDVLWSTTTCYEILRRILWNTTTYHDWRTKSSLEQMHCHNFPPGPCGIENLIVILGGPLKTVRRASYSNSFSPWLPVPCSLLLASCPCAKQWNQKRFTSNATLCRQKVCVFLQPSTIMCTKTQCTLMFCHIWSHMTVTRCLFLTSNLHRHAAKETTLH
jgi:hypothetical protein